MSTQDAEQASDTADVQNARPYEWTQVLRGIQLDKTYTVNGKNIAASTIKGIAAWLADYADYQTGADVFPGPARIAVEMQNDIKTVQRAYAVLRNLGLITLVAKGSGRRSARSRGADEYRLTIPADLLDRVSVIDPLEKDRAIERVRAAAKGKRGRSVTDVNGGPSGTPKANGDPVDNSEMGVPQGPSKDPTTEVNGGPSGNARSEMGVPQDPQWGSLRERVLSQVPPTTKTTNHDHLPTQPPDAQAPATPRKKSPSMSSTAAVMASRRQACRDCDSAGWLLGADGVRLDPPARCMHLAQAV